MKIPTWKTMGIPDIIVRNIKEMQPSYNLDCLINQLVFHQYKKTTSSYHCDSCGYTHIPQKIHEEVCFCPTCQSKKVRCIQSIKFSGGKVPYYSRTSDFINQIIRQMEMNFEIYFKNCSPKNIDWEWHNGIYHIAFANGDTGTGELPRIAIAKSAILSPYLWDSFFDWKNNCNHEIADQRFLTNLIVHLAPQRQK